MYGMKANKANGFNNIFVSSGGSLNDIDLKLLTCNQLHICVAHVTGTIWFQSMISFWGMLELYSVCYLYNRTAASSLPIFTTLIYILYTSVGCITRTKMLTCQVDPFPAVSILLITDTLIWCMCRSTNYLVICISMYYMWVIWLPWQPLYG